MSYTVKIVDNETGEVVVDETTAVCIVGGVAGETKYHKLGASCTDPFQLAVTLLAAEQMIDMIEEKNPLVKAMKMVVKASGKFDNIES